MKIQQNMTNTIVILEYNYKIVYQLNQNLNKLNENYHLLKKAKKDFKNQIIEDFSEQVDEGLDEEFIKNFVQKMSTKKIKKICS